MTITIAYYIAFLATCAYAFYRGGRTGRSLCALLLTTNLLTTAVTESAADYAGLALNLLAVDLLSLVGKVAIALRSSRRWPIWIAGFQLNSVAAQIGIIISPALRGDLYYAMVTVWALPTLAVIALGTALDERAAERRHPSTSSRFTSSMRRRKRQPEGS